MVRKKILILLTFILIIIFFIINSYAASNSLVINYEKNDTQFKVYSAQKFDIYDIDYKNSDYTTLLVSLIERDKIKEDYTGKIEDGKLIFNNIPDGYYLIVGTGYVDKNEKYTIMPTFIKITKDTSIIPKYEKQKTGKFNLDIVKSWVDSKNSHGEIEVSLYENGIKKETVKLNTKNNFKYTFKNLDREKEYTVFEENIPEGYKLNIKRNEDTFKLINTETSSQTITKEKLPQTGLLRWPIIYLLIGGIVCIIIAFIAKHKKIFMSISLVLLVCALILFLNNETESLEAQNNSNIITNELLQKIPNDVKDITNDIKNIDEAPEMEVINIDGVDYIGTLEIPERKLLLPVSSDWSMDNLKLSLCRYYGSIYTNDLVICGHNYTQNRHFGVLKNVKEGEEVYFRDVQNNIVKYNVVGIETIDPYDVESVKNNPYDLTLFTCTYGGNKRLVVRCNRIDN